MGVYWKIQLLGGGGLRKTNIEGGLHKKGAWTVCRFNGGAWQERGGGVFDGGLIPQCTICHSCFYPRKITYY